MADDVTPLSGLELLVWNGIASDVSKGPWPGLSQEDAMFLYGGPELLRRLIAHVGRQSQVQPDLLAAREVAEWAAGHCSDFGQCGYCHEYAGPRLLDDADDLDPPVKGHADTCVVGKYIALRDLKGAEPAPVSTAAEDAFELAASLVDARMQLVLDGSKTGLYFEVAQDRDCFPGGNVGSARMEAAAWLEALASEIRTLGRSPGSLRSAPKNAPGRSASEHHKAVETRPAESAGVAPGVRRMAPEAILKGVMERAGLFHAHVERSDAVDKILMCLWLYPNYNVSTRGPAGLLLDTLEILRPDVAEYIRRSNRPDVYREARRHFGFDEEDGDDEL